MAQISFWWLLSQSYLYGSHNINGKDQIFNKYRLFTLNNEIYHVSVRNEILHLNMFDAPFVCFPNIFIQKDIIWHFMHIIWAA